MRRVLACLVVLLACRTASAQPPPISWGGGGGSGSVAPGSFSSSTGTITIGGTTNAVTIDATTSVVPLYSTGTSDPATCTAGGMFHLRTDSTLLKFCAATDTWLTLYTITDDSVLVGTGTTTASKAIPDCDDTTGQHLNYDTTTNAFSCGTSGSGAFLLNASGGASAPTVSASTTNYFFPWGGTSGNASESVRSIAISETCTLSRFYVTTQATQSATGDLVFTVRANGSDTALVVTVAANSAAGVFSDTTHTASVTAGQTMSVKVANAATATSTPINGWSLKCTP